MLWSDEGVEGSFRFIRRLWTAVHEHVKAGPAPALDIAALNAAQKALRRAAHQTLAKVTDDIGRRHTFNTAVAAVMELLNTVGRFDDASPQGRAVRQEAFSIIAVALSPIVPHVCHTLWQSLGHSGALIDQPWPAVDAAALVQDEIEISVQVNGKMRARVSIAAGADEATVRSAVMADERVQKFVGVGPARKVIYVPGKLVNIVV
jgi:leucyl-tRNA synthetase